MKTYAKADGLDPVDAILAATAMANDLIFSTRSTSEILRGFVWKSFAIPKKPNRKAVACYGTDLDRLGTAYEREPGQAPYPW